MLRTVRIVTSLGADDSKAIERLLTRAMLDTELAAHLFTRKTADAGSPAWNKELGKLLRRVEAGRELNGDEQRRGEHLKMGSKRLD